MLGEAPGESELSLGWPSHPGTRLGSAPHLPVRQHPQLWKQRLRVLTHLAEAVIKLCSF